MMMSGFEQNRGRQKNVQMKPRMRQRHRWRMWLQYVHADTKFRAEADFPRRWNGCCHPRKPYTVRTGTYEQERHWEHVCWNDYHCIATHPLHLSLWKRIAPKNDHN